MPVSKNGRHDVLFQTPENSGHVMEWLWKLILAPKFEDRKPNVLDMTYGKGVFWRWNGDWRDHLNLVTMDKDETTGADIILNWFPHRFDREGQQKADEFVNNYGPDSEISFGRFDVIVIDPPFSSIGPSKLMQGAAKRSGADRKQNGIRNYHDIESLYQNAISFALTLAPQYIVLKSENVIESQIYRDTLGLIYYEFQERNRLGGTAYKVISMVHQWHKAKPQSVPQKNFDNSLSQWTVWDVRG